MMTPLRIAARDVHESDVVRRKPHGHNHEHDGDGERQPEGAFEHGLELYRRPASRAPKRAAHVRALRCADGRDAVAMAGQQAAEPSKEFCHDDMVTPFAVRGQ